MIALHTDALAIKIGAFCFPNLLWKIQTDAPVLYLTFDDGVSPQSTPKLLNFLVEQEIEATHFLLGSQVAKYPYLLDELISAKQQIGNHGHVHQDAWKKGFNAVGFAEAQQHLETHCPIHLLRPPYGHFSPKLLRWAQNTQQKVVMWDVNGADFRTHISDDTLAENLLKNVRKGSIVLLHDNPKFIHKTLSILTKTIPTLKMQGWHFKSIGKI